MLVVNDSLEQLALIRTVLDDAGYDVYTAPDGYEGVTFARSIKPDAILSDVAMPRVDGHWSATPRRELNPSARTRC